ncbi:MAG: heavy metal-associated domain-containing protein [Rhodospirillaceae bacterium]|nr:heavy metal-associated domain-containing protein [Rhodospirillaceae bacterium]
MNQIVLPVRGMTCGGCVKSVERAMLRQPGVVSASASLPQAAVTVDFNPAEIDPARLKAAIVAAGYQSP